MLLCSSFCQVGITTPLANGHSPVTQKRHSLQVPRALEAPACTKMSSDKLPTALSNFQRLLSSDEAARLASFSDQTPTPDDIVKLTNQITKDNNDRYCKSYWHSHSRYIDLQDTIRLTTLENFIIRTNLPKEWILWSAIEAQAPESLYVWKSFIWALSHGHTAIFTVCRNMVTTQESEYWRYLWDIDAQGVVFGVQASKQGRDRLLVKGEDLFASACEGANLE